MPCNSLAERLPASALAPRRTGKLPLCERKLIGPRQADDLTRLFKMLASSVRMRLLHAMERNGELCVTDLAGTIKSSPQAVSNHLQRLVDQRIVAQRRDGNFVYYRIADPCVAGLLDLGLCLLEETKRRRTRT